MAETSSHEIPSGVARMKSTIITILSFMTVFYVTLLWTFSGAPTILGLTPGDDFCVDATTANATATDTPEPCSRADLFAFQMTGFFAIVICGLAGVYTWHISRRAHRGVPQTPAGRLFAHLPEAEFIAAVCFSFQVWDFFISLSIPEHRTAIMLTHHFLAATVSWFSIRYQVLHYYGVFFLGLSEFSSIFLIFVDLSNYYPPTPGSLYDEFIAAIAGPLFAISFIVYRVILWWPVSLRLFRDVSAVVRSGQAEKLRPGHSWVLYVFLAINIPLGLLQLYWFTIILEEARKVLLN